VGELAGRRRRGWRRRAAPRGRGLAIAAGIAERYGGRLSAAPSSTGARVVLELPSADASPGHEPLPPAGPLGPDRPLDRPHRPRLFDPDARHRPRLFDPDGSPSPRAE
jgi:hypothetical protein